MANLPYDCYDWDSIDDIDPKDELIHDCREQMQEIISHLFSDGELNRIALDDALCVICNLLDVEIPPKMLTIQRREKSRLFSNAEAQSLYITKKTI